MKALDFWKAVTVDRSNLLENLIGLLEDNKIQYCLIGGQGVNAFVAPLVSLDLDIAVAAPQLEFLESLLPEPFKIERFQHSLNISAPDSSLRVQIQTDPRYASFPERASRREVLGLTVPVANLEDLIQGKVWAASDPGRRPSKRRKDLLDIERLLEAYPELRARVPAELLDRLN